MSQKKKKLTNKRETSFENNFIFDVVDPHGQVDDTLADKMRAEPAIVSDRSRRDNVISRLRLMCPRESIFAHQYQYLSINQFRRENPKEDCANAVPLFARSTRKSQIQRARKFRTRHSGGLFRFFSSSIVASFKDCKH